MYPGRCSTVLPVLECVYNSLSDAVRATVKYAITTLLSDLFPVKYLLYRMDSKPAKVVSKSQTFPVAGYFEQ